MTSFNNVRESEHIRKLKDHSVATVKVGIIASEFMRKKAALQEKYATDLNALVEACRIRTQSSQLQGVHGFEDTPVFSIWDKMRDVSLKESTAVSEEANDCKNLSIELNTILTRKKRLMKMVFADVQEMERGVKTLEQTCERSRLANKASAEAAAAAGAQPTGMMKKISENKLVGGFFNKLTKERASSKEQLELNSHNDYALEVISANSQKSKFYNTDLKKALEAAENIYVTSVDQTKQVLNHYSERLVQSYNVRKQVQEELIAKVSAISGDSAASAAMIKLGIDTTKQGWDLVEFKTGQDGVVSEPALQVQDGDTVSLLQKRLAQLERNTTALAADMSKRIKSVDGLENLYKQYLATPSFGSPDEVFEKLYMEKQQVRNILTMMQRNNAVIEVIQHHNISIEAEDIPPSDAVNNRANVISIVTDGGEEEDWDNDDGVEEPSQPEGDRIGLALYDYVPQTSEHGEEIALVAGEVIRDVEAVDVNWSKGRVANRYGLFPASYCHFFYGEPERQVLALYNYTAAQENELSIVADEVLTVIEPEEVGWTLVRRDTDGLQGLVPGSYLDVSFVKLPQSERVEKAGVVAMSPSMAISGFLDDLDGETDDIEEDNTSTDTSAQIVQETQNIGGEAATPNAPTSTDEWPTAPVPAASSGSPPPPPSASSKPSVSPTSELSLGERKLPVPRSSSKSPTGPTTML